MKLRSRKINACKEPEPRTHIRKTVLKTQLVLKRTAKRMQAGDSQERHNEPSTSRRNPPDETDPSVTDEQVVSAQEEVVGRIEQTVQTRRKRMTDHVKPVEALKLTGNLSENWRRFKRNFDIFMTAAELNEKSNGIKVSTLLNAIGDEAVDVYESFNLTNEQKASYEAVVKAFADFCTPKKNEVYERYVFYQRKQKEGELFDSFLMEIKKLVRTCGFADENQMLRDQIVMGINDQRLQTRLLEIADLTYDVAVQKCRTNEITREQASTMNNNNISVHEVQKDAHTKNRNPKNHTNDRRSNTNKHNHSARSSNNTKPKAKEGQQQQSSGRQQQQQPSTRRIDCTYCGLTHNIRECPAYGKICNKCSRKNHYASVCKSRNVAEIFVNDNSDCSYDNEEFYIGAISFINEKESATTEDSAYPWKEKIQMNGKSVPSKIDTGAELDVMPLSVLMQLPGKIELRKTGINLRAFGGQKVAPVGICTLSCNFGGKNIPIRFAVVDLSIAPIIGLNTCIKFGIVKPTEHACLGRRINTA